MLDIKKIREETKEIEVSLKKRLGDVNLGLDKIILLDDTRKKIILELEGLKAEKNKLSKTKPDEETIKNIKKNNTNIKDLEDSLNQVEDDLHQKMSSLPNIVAPEVLAGGKENNKVSYTFKEKPKFSFKAKDHVELAESLDIIDYKRAAKMSGSGFWLYKGDGALLEWALLNYFIDFHTKNNYQFIIPPFLLNKESAYASGHMPKFRDDLFWVEDGLCLNATAEMMLGNYHRDEILKEEDLPLKYFAYSACFRREAGSYRQEERGMIRGHQFNKIEMFQYTKPEDSWTVFEEMKNQATKLLEGLDLHFQVSDLAAGDCSAAMAKTVDLEVWIPSMNIYKEVSSASNALDYQARRGNMRFKDKNGKNEFLHTLNASGLATSRLLPAILEQNQQEDGSVLIPEVLKQFLPIKLDKISKK
ncbi:serine--tRNA ligase [Candidatus Falkowbacteria bacterium HGW-Falkowbacteria-1]|uniref:Serine--tRNA ligase n=1 Tax=Candidatus Falkowbacteria bacterium HGW-Falkowbacteria-1 TaxID=2013768 RepID=A0A2N2E9D8_9BACT|nr:MAG: serine--tRNA ligase [Candidatus Falkowbacteria bacterium HGW-Falkowbacteria-1]